MHNLSMTWLKQGREKLPLRNLWSKL